jgi:hypothetical protein
MAALAVAGGPSVAFITVIGTLGGAAVTGAVVLLTAWLTQRSQGQRAGQEQRFQLERAEQEQRFQIEREQRAARRDSYARYGDAIKKVYVQCLRIANNCRGLGRRSEEMDYDQAIAELQQLTDQRTALWESVLLLGDPETIAAGRAWHRTVWQVERFARGIRTQADAWQPLLDEIEALRVAFYKAARKDLGIESGDVPAAGPWDQEPDAQSASAPKKVVAAGESVQAETMQQW